MPDQEAKRQTRRLDPLALFEDLGYRPHPGQLLVHRSKARHRVLACGTRWGKSTLGANETIAELLEPRENGLGWLVCPTYDLTRRIFDRVVMTLHQHLKHRVQRYLPREHEIAVTNLGGGTSILRAKSADNRVSLLGEGLDWVVVDEAAQLPTTMWDEHVSGRLIDRRGSSLVLSTPMPNGGWFYEAWKRGQKGRDPETESWRSPSWDNPHISREVIEAERGRLAPDTFEQQYEAKFLGVPAEPCESCGGPRKDVLGRVTAPVGQFEDDFLPRCPSCRMFVGEDGKSIVKMVNPGYASFDIDRPWTETGSLTMFSWYTFAGDGPWRSRGRMIASGS